LAPWGEKGKGSRRKKKGETEEKSKNSGGKFREKWKSGGGGKKDQTLKAQKQRNCEIKRAHPAVLVAARERFTHRTSTRGPSGKRRDSPPHKNFERRVKVCRVVGC